MNSVVSSGLRKQFRGYSGARPDVMALIETLPQRVLDVGCGAGVMAVDLAARFPGITVVGVEADPALAEISRGFMSVLIQGRVDDASVLDEIAASGPFDLILCADVLEHLAYPDRVLARLAAMLTPDGRLITSIPNVRHASTFVSLGLLGTWPSRSRGIHDRDHLRFFSRSNILALGKNAGLRMERERRNLRLIESVAWTIVPAKLLDFWPFRSFLTFQYLHRWHRGRSVHA